MSTLSTNIRPSLGEGIFTTRDVAHILGVPTSSVGRWLTEFWNKRFGSNFGGYSFGGGRGRAINFYTLIEFIVFAKLRENGISAQKIQRYHNYISERLNTKFPFAETKLRTDKRSVWYENSHVLIKIDGKEQIAIREILEPFLNKIEYSEDKIATRFFPLGKDHHIVIDPNHQFGQPTILGTNIKVSTIYSLYLGNETPESISSLYEIPVEQVKEAIDYSVKNAA